VILHKSILFTDKVVLQPSVKSFSMEFSGIHTQSSNKELYRYKLEGFDNDWIYTNSQHRAASYSNLDPGRYTLWIEASSGDGVWAEAPKYMEIEVLPSFWRGKYGYLLYFLGFVGIVYLYTRYTIVRTNTKNELLLQKYKQEHEL